MKRILLYTLSMVLLLAACGKSAGSQSEPQALTWQEQYDLGVRYLSEGNYEEAIIAFTAAIEIDPKRAPAYVGRGDAYVLSGETEENLMAAQADYEKAIALDDSSADAYLGLADVYIRRGDYDKALEILQQGLKEIGESQEISNKIAEMEAGNISDSSGKTRRETGFDGAGTVQYYIDYTYDTEGRRYTVSSYDSSGSLTGYAKCSYDEYGRQIDDFYTHNSDNKTVNPLKRTLDVNGKEIRSDWYWWNDGSLHQYTETDYNSNGDRVEWRVYAPDGTITQRNQWEYASQSVIRGETVYHYSDGKIRDYTISSYNSDGKEKEAVRYSADGKVTGRQEFIYNSEGFQTEWRGYNANSELEWYHIYRYDEQGKRIGQDHYDGAGNLTSSEVYN